MNVPTPDSSPRGSTRSDFALAVLPGAVRAAPPVLGSPGGSTHPTGAVPVGVRDGTSARLVHPASFAPWKLLILDDDPAVHAVTRMVLKDFSFKNRKLLILSEYSEKDGRRVLAEHSDIAVVLLDVIMESDTAGLDLVRHIRDDLDNHLVRIILRTGQPGMAPEHSVVNVYDINDYREKTDLTAQKLLTAVTMALRSYDDLLAIHTLSEANERLADELSTRKHEIEQTAEDLRRSEARLAEAQRIALVGSFEWDLIHDTTIWSDELRRILGVPDSPAGSGLDLLRTATVPEDRSALDAALDRIRAECGACDLVHRIARPDGTLRVVHHQAAVRCDDAGVPIRLVGTLQDITDSHQAQARIRQLSSAMEQTADAVMIVRADGTIEYVNAAFSTMTGYAKEDALGQGTQFLGSDKQGAAYYERLWRQVREGRTVTDVMLNRRKDGTLYHESQTITPQRDASGDITHFIVTGRDVSDWMRVQEKMEHMAHHDALTGLPNRTLLADRLQQALARARRQQRQIAVAFLDLDRFKVINDSLGHEAGDLLLKATASRLLACVREGDTVARLGGDEFAVILNDLSGREDVLPVARKIIAALQSPVPLAGHDVFVTTSIGISMFPGDGGDGSSLLKHADAAMYRAKSRGRNTYEFHEGGNDATEVARLDLATGLRLAIRNRELFLVYQPEIDVSTGRTIAVEALLRWRRQDGQVVPPRDFLPLIEEPGMAVEIFDWALDTACADVRRLHAAGIVNCRVAVNVSSHQFRNRDFARHVSELLRRTDVQARFLELELSESVLTETAEDAIAALARLRASGLRLTINDLGAGHSSLRSLARFALDAVKIDRMFLEECAAKPEGQALLSAVASLARTIGLDTVALGVETQEQARLATEAGCTILQGSLISPPREIADFIQLWTSQDSHGAPGAA